MIILAYIGWAVFVIGWIWTIVTAFKSGGLLWGILNIIPAQPLIGIITAVVKKVAWQPVIVTIIGCILTWGFGGMVLLSR